MTPKRKKYLANCSEREKELRLNINQAKINLAVFKMAVIKQGMLPILKNSIKSTKCRLVAYYHELHRLKGMNRVVVPKQRIVFASPTENFNVGDTLGRCKCGQVLDSALMKFCPNCGRKILWKKVK